MTNPYIELAYHYKSEVEEDAYRQNRNYKYLESLRSNPKINIDEVLAEKDDDDRFGCCIVARPPDHIKSLISSIQYKLKDSVSGSSALWISPSEYLHMTVMEIDNSSSQDKIKEIVNILLSNIDQLIAVANNGPELGNPLVCFDANAVALTFTSVNKSHIKYRLELFDWITHCGVNIRPRYCNPSAHITIMRFVEDLCEDELKLLLDEIQVINNSLINTKWKVSNCEFNYGLIWYGQKLQNVHHNV